MTNEECLNSHIVNLKEISRLFCQDCNERQKGIAICQCAIEADLCPYVKSLNFVIEFLKRIKE
jgi:hypothetical protein